jgi:hypothetical protein
MVMGAARRPRSKMVERIMKNWHGLANKPLLPIKAF